ncbi:MAG: DUF3467 domain-containing protein [Acidobacteriota bacterium]
MSQQSSRLNIKIDDEELKGRYSNVLRVAHTREEFILDFINLLPPQGAVTARVITGPGHLKRIYRALGSALEAYERAHGAIQEAADPGAGGNVH